MSIVKHSIGIDISKDTFTACACTRRAEDLLFSQVKKFKNEPTGLTSCFVAKIAYTYLYLMEEQYNL